MLARALAGTAGRGEAGRSSECRLGVEVWRGASEGAARTPVRAVAAMRIWESIMGYGLSGLDLW